MFKYYHLKQLLQLSSVLKSAYTPTSEQMTTSASAKFRRSENTRIKDAVQALALCHNVTPVYENNDGSDSGINS